MDHLITLQEIFRDVFDEPTLAITAATTPDDLEEWDSVAHVKLVLAVEEAFGIRLATAEVSEIRSVGDFLRAIDRHL